MNEAEKQEVMAFLHDLLRHSADNIKNNDTQVCFYFIYLEGINVFRFLLIELYCQ